MSEQDIKAALKEALKEWLNEKILLFGKWSLRVLASAALSALVYFIISMNGFHK